MVFLFPTEFEAAPFRELCPSADIIICGVGMAATAATMSRVVASKPDIVILAGIAGSYDTQSHPINEVVEVVREQIEGLPSQFAIAYDIEARFGLAEVSSNSVNSSNFVDATSDIEQMEGAAAAAIAAQAKIPFAQIRAISNRVGDPSDKWSIKSAIAALATELSTIYNNR